MMDFLPGKLLPLYLPSWVVRLPFADVASFWATGFVTRKVIVLRPRQQRFTYTMHIMSRDDLRVQRHLDIIAAELVGVVGFAFASIEGYYHKDDLIDLNTMEAKTEIILVYCRPALDQWLNMPLVSAALDRISGCVTPYSDTLTRCVTGDLDGNSHSYLQELLQDWERCSQLHHELDSEVVAMTRAPFQSTVRPLRGMSFFLFAQGKIEEAPRFLNQAYTHTYPTPGFTKFSAMAEILVEEGLLCLARCDHVEARQKFESAVAKFDKYANPYVREVVQRVMKAD